MKIMHTYCLNNNLGDYALGMGVKNIFRSLYNVSLFAESNIQGQIFDDYFIDIINKKYDLLIIGGGGIIHGAHWPQGWFWLIDKEKIKKIKIPFIVYGVGYNYFKDETGIPSRGILHLRETAKRASFFSVRTDKSHERLLEQANINAEEIADPGFWVPLGRSFNKNKIKGRYVVVQLANDKPLNRFGLLKNREIFVKKLRSILLKISKEYLIVFAPHVYEDITLSILVAEGIDNSEVIDFGEFAFDRASEFIGIYKDAEFVLAMRGHGQIVPLGFNVPVIALENHDKHRGLMEEYGLERYNVNILDKSFSEKMEKMIAQLTLESSVIKEHIRRKNIELLDDTRFKLKNIREISKYLKK